MSQEPEKLFLVTLDGSVAYLIYYVLVEASTYEQAEQLARFKYPGSEHRGRPERNGMIDQDPFILDEIGISQILEAHQ